jgi:hypothetical protein
MSNCTALDLKLGVVGIATQKWIDILDARPDRLEVEAKTSSCAIQAKTPNLNFQRNRYFVVKSEQQPCSFVA